MGILSLFIISWFSYWILLSLLVTERRRRSLHRRLPSGTPCPRVRLAYSLRQPRVVYTFLRPWSLRSIAQRLVDSSNTYVQQPLLRVSWHYVAPFSPPTPSLRPILRLYDTAGAASWSSVSTSNLRTTIVRWYSLLATMSSPKSNLIP